MTRWVAVDHPHAKEFATVEADGIDNESFFSVIAERPYNGSRSAIEVLHLKDEFQNRAQHVWKERLAQEGDKILYNGAKIDNPPENKM